MTTFADTNFLISLTKPSDVHHAWSAAQFAVRKALGPIVICDIVYCEFSVTMGSQQALDTTIAELALERIARSDAALFRAGQAFGKYRKANKGQLKDRVLPDFIVGAVAEIARVPLLTADKGRFSTYFPTVQVIAP